jgi:hypothetical protein
MGELRPKPWVPLFILVMGPLGGALLGALTNLINGSISWEYFSIVMGWDPVASGFLAIPQGMLEGGALGTLFGVVVAFAFGVMTRFSGGLALAVRAWLLAAMTVLVCWTIGGACGAILGYTEPDLFRALFPLSRALSAGIVRFAWVGGSIWGAYAGTVVGCVLACVYLYVKWRRVLRQAGAAFEVLPAAGNG